MPSHKRDLKKSALGKKTEPHRDVRQCDGRVHVARMIRYEYVAAIFLDLFKTLYLNAYAADGEQRTRPRPFDGVLLAAIRVKERHDQAGRSIHNCGDGDQWIGNQQRSK